MLCLLIQAGVYEADFNAERQSREEAQNRYMQMSEIVKALEFKNKTLEVCSFCVDKKNTKKSLKIF